MLKTPRVALFVLACARVYTSGRRRKPSELRADSAVPNNTSRSTRTSITVSTVDHDSSLRESAEGDRAEKGQDPDQQDDVEVGLGVHEDRQDPDHPHQGVADRVQRQDPVLQGRARDQAVQRDDDGQREHDQRKGPQGGQIQRLTSMIARSKIRFDARTPSLKVSVSIPWM